VPRIQVGPAPLIGPASLDPTGIVALHSSSLGHPASVIVQSLLKHVVAVMEDDLRAGSFLQSDATGLPVLDGRKNKARRGHLWSYTHGVPCPETPMDVGYNAEGGSGVPVVGLNAPCAGSWSNHGKYQSTVVTLANIACDSGRLSNKERAAIVRAAAESDCGQ
jgi:hypothetical protein